MTPHRASNGIPQLISLAELSRRSNRPLSYCLRELRAGRLNPRMRVACGRVALFLESDAEQLRKPTHTAAPTV